MITKRQKQILDFINGYTKKHRYSPSLEEIKRGFHLSSVATVHQHVEALKTKGYLDKQKNQRRSIEISKTEKLVRIPLLGTIAAGEPIEAIQEKEIITLPKSKVPNGKDVYALRVSGDSMVEENIDDGDMVIVQNQPTAENGQKIVALIDESSATLKKYYREKGMVRLQPANSAIKPVIIHPSQLTIQGIVVDVIKNENKIIEERKVPSVFHVTPKAKGPKGGCELVYSGKIKEDEILENTEPAILKLIKKYGVSTENRLFIGDNLNILKSLFDDRSVKGKIDLIYIDPPFGTGQEFVGYDQEKSYSDKLKNAEFLEFLRKRLIFLRELLSEHGSIYLHIDQKIGHYVKILMDEIFGEENFRNDITRIKCNPKNFDRKAFGNVKDVIYFYSKTRPNGNDKIFWADYRLALTEDEKLKQFPKIDSRGRRYATTPLHAKGETLNGPTGKHWKGLLPPKGRHWRYNPKELTRLDDQGLIEWSTTGNPRKKIYEFENRGKKIQDVWDFKDPGFESALYPTQKNKELLKQIIQCSSKEDALVLDCFAGSGTTLLAAQELNRRWIGIDLNKNAVNLIEKEMLKLKKIKSPDFAVYSS